jgi:PhzF family phenazine biosynthesis protein
VGPGLCCRHATGLHLCLPSRTLAHGSKQLGSVSKFVEQSHSSHDNRTQLLHCLQVDVTETAVSRSSKGPFSSQQRFRLRWFTPAAEVPLCGHATLAAAYVLFAGGSPAQGLAA